tara:strand:+ start:19408 stop:19809 length:402 start_codon:yes stop_codon:yes gene_type:complete
MSEQEEKCSSVQCICEDPENCESIQAFKKLVYCNVSECLWNVPIKTPKVIKHHKGYVPIGDTGSYKGVCKREDVGVGLRVVNTFQTKNKLAECQYRSDKFIAGHIDFAKMLDSSGNPYGGTIPDPVDPGAAFH